MEAIVMNYDKVIVELLTRIQVLEDQVKLLMEKQQDNDKPQNKISTGDIRDYIKFLKTEAKNNGCSVLTIKAGDIHREKKLKSAMPMVCNAMRQCMGSEDRILHQTASGYSSTLEIEYKLKKEI